MLFCDIEVVNLLHRTAWCCCTCYILKNILTLIVTKKKKKSLSSWTETKIYAGKFTVGAGVAIVLGIYKQVSL